MRSLSLLAMAFALTMCLGQAPPAEQPADQEPASAAPAETLPPGEDAAAMPEGDGAEVPMPVDTAPTVPMDDEAAGGEEAGTGPVEEPAGADDAAPMDGDPAPEEEMPAADEGPSLTDVILGATAEPDYDPHRYFLYWEPCESAFAWEVPRESVAEILESQPVLLYRVHESLLEESQPHWALDVAAGLPTGVPAHLRAEAPAEEGDPEPGAAGEAAECEGEGCSQTLEITLLGGSPWEPADRGSRGAIHWPVEEDGEGWFEDADGSVQATVRAEPMGFAIELSEAGTQASAREASDAMSDEMVDTLFGEIMAILDQEGMGDALQRFSLALTRVMDEETDFATMGEAEAQALLDEAMDLLNSEDRALIDEAMADLEAGVGSLATPAVDMGSGLTCGDRGPEALSTAWMRADWLPMGGNLRLTFTYQHKPDPATQGNWILYVAKVEFHNLDNGHKGVALFNFSGDIHKITVMDAFRRVVRVFDFKFPYEGDFSLREVMRVRAVESRMIGSQERTLGTYLIPYETYRTLISAWLHPAAWGREGAFNLAISGDAF